MSIDWREKYCKKFGRENMPNFWYPLKDKYAKIFRKSKNLYSDIFEYCYVNNINAKDIIEYPSKEVQEWLDNSGVLY